MVFHGVSGVVFYFGWFFLSGALARWFVRTFVVRTRGDDRGYGSDWFGSVRILEFPPASRNASFY
jgi:hypothetical protein